MNTVLRSASVLALAASALSASAGSLSTLFAANNDGDSLWTNFFDVTALASPLSITSLGLNIAQDSATSTPGLAFSVGIYTKSGTYSGSEANAGVWTLRATGTGTTAALNSPSAATFSAFTIPVGTSGFAIRYTVPSNSLVGPVYTNGTGTNTSYANADLTIVAGQLGGQHRRALLRHPLHSPRLERHDQLQRHAHSRALGVRRPRPRCDGRPAKAQAGLSRPDSTVRGPRLRWEARPRTSTPTTLEEMPFTRRHEGREAQPSLCPLVRPSSVDPTQRRTCAFRRNGAPLRGSRPPAHARLTVPPPTWSRDASSHSIRVRSRLRPRRRHRLRPAAPLRRQWQRRHHREVHPRRRRHDLRDRPGRPSRPRGRWRGQPLRRRDQRWRHREVHPGRGPYRLPPPPGAGSPRRVWRSTPPATSTPPTSATAPSSASPRAGSAACSPTPASFQRAWRSIRRATSMSPTPSTT